MGPPERARARARVAHARRAALAALLLVAPAALAGCLSGAEANDPREGLTVARPADPDFPTEVPQPAGKTSTTREKPADPRPDPRLNLSVPWKRGDTWYYESNRSNFQKVTVLGGVVYDGVTYYRVRTDYGIVGDPPLFTSTSTVTRDFRTINSTYANGETRFDPPDPGLRFLWRDGDYTYNATIVKRSTLGEARTRVLHSVHVVEEFPLYPVRVPAGTFNASYFQLFDASCEPGRCGAGQLRLLETHRFYSPDVGNDVMFRTNVDREEEENFQLVYTIQGGKRIGVDVTYERR